MTRHMSLTAREWWGVIHGMGLGAGDERVFP